jgi:glycine/D-amino acid oxidase-like deaminating enzyme
MQKKKAIILGAGVNGITTGITLQLAGFATKIITKHKPGTNNNDSAYASHIPAASILPHSVSTPKKVAVFEQSQIVFDALHKAGFPGLSRHHHYEIYTSERPAANYHKLIDDFRSIDPNDPFLPRWAYQGELFGWQYRCLFADWPVYFDAIIELYQQLGGVVENGNLNLNDVRSLPSDLIINCTGIRSAELFRESFTTSLGHVQFIPGAPMITHKSGEAISYNVSPGAGVYAHANGEEADVYFYPRSNGWTFGGSRVVHEFDEFDEDKLRDKESLQPKTIYELNREVIMQSYGIDADVFQESIRKKAWRFIRKQEKGLKIEPDKLGEKLIIHNIGHGGAGVTLSWGCALEVLKILKAETAFLPDLLINPADLAALILESRG